ncbi:MAG TPA: MATE family efflux transporter [Acidimicrobiales bacterium]|jgi:putative MATE family efflux protein|nr:MATE family efflux transporter [Actinomycetota bacterium]MDP6062047.1 MATE family efflux transporter [Acidimicrobiales bacterium]MDP7209890.1 MATE family efflux transporter [Acidimicrobiales bacterium]HJL89235.1 MATE family efflux transporter [Acidimicrobiales bacterium]HJO99236.1 MATE family efflux transporter [Acidimicrobiales bacterium]|tara:strand:- start:22930 stop:24255 length:1326 start_codon:yes stop_codon:yes gene_type:complete
MAGPADTNREILRLAVPALGALMAEPLYVLADTAVVGHLGTESLGGLAIASAALLVGYNVCIFLAYGSTAAVARLMGADQKAAAAHQAIQGLWLAVVLGIGLAVLGMAFTEPFLRLLGAGDNVLREATTYFRISLLGAPGMLLMLAGVGYLRGTKDTLRPLWVGVGTAVVNLAVELVLIYGLGMGIGASAAATVVAQWLGAGFYLFWIVREAGRHDVGLRPDLEAIRRLLVVGADLLVRTVSLVGTFTLATAVAARIGTVQVAAHQIAFQIWFLLAMAMDAMAIAAQAMVGNLLGAGRADEARRVGNRVVAWSIGIGLSLGVVLVAGVTAAGDTIPRIFSADPAVIALVGFLLLHVAMMAPLSGLAFALDGILIGAGDQRFLAQAMGLSFAIFVPAAVVGRSLGAGIGWLWGAIWLFMAVRSVILFGRFRGARWQVLGSAD